MSDEHDNTNRGALWSCKGFAGKLNIGGSDMYILCVQTRAQNEKAPIYQAIVRDGDHSSIVPIWKPKKEGSKSLGVFEYAEHMVNIFKNEPSENPNAPTLRLSAMPKEPIEHSDFNPPLATDDCPF